MTYGVVLGMNDWDLGINLMVNWFENEWSNIFTPKVNNIIHLSDGQIGLLYVLVNLDRSMGITLEWQLSMSQSVQKKFPDVNNEIPLIKKWYRHLLYSFIPHTLFLLDDNIGFKIPITN